MFVLGVVRPDFCRSVLLTGMKSRLNETMLVRASTSFSATILEDFASTIAFRCLTDAEADRVKSEADEEFVVPRENRERRFSGVFGALDFPALFRLVILCVSREVSRGLRDVVAPIELILLFEPLCPDTVL